MEKRIANWLAVAEYALYIPMRNHLLRKWLDFLRINCFNFASFAKLYREADCRHGHRKKTANAVFFTSGKQGRMLLVGQLVFCSKL